MKRTLLILFIVVSFITLSSRDNKECCPQSLFSSHNQAATTTSTTTRVLIDIGGRANVQGVMTPDNNTPIGADANGRYWNNITGLLSGAFTKTGFVDTANNSISGLTLTWNQKPGGDYFSDSSMNPAGSVTTVGDYPSTAVRDNAYYYKTPNNNHQINVTIPSGYTGTIKFWGNRALSGPRILEFGLDGVTYGSSYDAGLNTTYSNGVTFSGLSAGTTTIYIRVGSTSTFGYISVIDIHLTTT